jgi:hypothetical protein
MSANLIDNAALTSPTIDTFDPDQIAGASYKVSASGFPVWRFIKAPSSGGPHTLKFKCASRWNATIPGGSFDLTTGAITLDFDDGNELRDVQVTEIIKAGSTAGTWIVAP